MRSTFLGFNTARSGLFAAQRALDITGHNIANVNTPGYSRQRLEQTQSVPQSIMGGQGMLGTGVDSVAIHQLRNGFLDFRYRDEANSLAYWETRRDGLAFVEAMLNEPSDTGLNAVMDQFFSALQELSKEQNVDELTHRALVLDRASGVTNSITHLYDQMEKLVVDLNFDIQSTITTINGLTRQIAQMNKQIYMLETDGSNANDLRDQRNVLIDQLSEHVKVDILEVSDPNDASGMNNVPKKMVLQIAGQPIVYHDRSYDLDASTREKSGFFSELGVDLELNKIQWADGSHLNPNSLKGGLRALLDLRDGETAATKGLPYYISKLNEFARTFAKEVNEVARTGYGLKGEMLDEPMGNNTQGAGYLLFTAFGRASEEMYDDNGNIMHHRITAQNIGVALDMEDLNKLPASASLALLPGDASVVMDLLALRNKSAMFAEGKPEDFMKSLVSNLGVDMQEAMRNAANQQVLTQQIDNERMRYSGVSIDEEMANMVRFQHSYNASARMITTVDEMLDVIINRLGLVGR